MFSDGAAARETRHSERAPAGSGLVVPKQPRIDVVRGIFSDNGCETAFPESAPAPTSRDTPLTSIGASEYDRLV